MTAAAVVVMLVTSVLPARLGRSPAGSGGQDGEGLQAGSYEVTSARLGAANSMSRRRPADRSQRRTPARVGQETGQTGRPRDRSIFTVKFLAQSDLEIGYVWCRASRGRRPR